MSKRNVLYHTFSIIRVLFYPFALIYGAIVWLRNRMYDAGVYSSIQFMIPVIAIGNLSVGGTGKTPHVEYLIRLLQYRFKAATMSRGYKRRTQGFILADEKTNALRIGDEPMQYYMKFSDLAVSVAEERITGIPRLLQLRPDIEVILLDDAYQHRSVKAGLNILITDFEKPFYKDHILPLGTLRENRAAYKRADVIIVSKCPPDLSPEAAKQMEADISPLPNQQVFFSYIRYVQPYDLLTKEPVSIAGKHAVLVCCIAKPQPLVRYLHTVAKDVHLLSYADHHYFVSSDLEEIKAAYDNWQVADKLIVTTEKDAARLYLHLEKLQAWNIRIIVLPIEIDFLFASASEFDNIVLNFTESTIAANQTFFNGTEEN